MMSTLLSTPLFQGLTMDELMKILEQVRPDFIRVSDTYILHRGEQASRLVYILSGRVWREVTAADDSFRFAEIQDVGTYIELSTLFGRDTTLRADYLAEGEVTLLAFDKKYLFSVFNHFDIVQLNLLNLLNLFCAQTQAIYDRQMPSLKAGRPAIDDAMRALFCRFIRTLSEHPWGEKRLDVTRVELARLLGCSRRRMSDEIGRWERQGLVTLAYSRIIIPDLPRLEELRVKN